MFKQEKIVETKICKHCNCQFEITDKDMEFYDKISPIFSGKKYNIPTPNLCPDCRQQRRLSFTNIYKLYKSKNKDGKEFISPFSPDKGYNIISSIDWYNEVDSGLNYGIDFNFSKSFFEQFHNLQIKVPRWDRMTLNSEGCDWNLNLVNSKNCYLCNSSVNLENGFYSNKIYNGRNIVDCFLVYDSDYCYQLVNSKGNLNIFFGENITNSKNSMFIYECDNIEYCIGCVGLKYKKYFFLNKEVGKDEYFKILDKIQKDNNFKIEIIKEFEKLKSSFPRKNLNLINVENCNGDEILNSKNIKNGFFVNDSEDCNNIYFGGNTKSSQDCTNPDYSELVYETGFDFKIYHSCFSYNSAELKNCFYCESCINCLNCFGCVGLFNKQYCILNKQYTKQEYEELVPRIIEHIMKIGEWGEFFPSSISPFGYNETVAQEYYPIPHPDHLLRGEGERFKWSDYEPPFPKVEKIIPANKLPGNIKDIPDDILNWAIECEITKKPFRIISQELEFYRKHNLPIPKRHPDQRHLDRIALRNPRKLFDRKCDKCGKDIKTTYNPERKEIVYCEECYNREVY